jgi:hypothetical protein
MERMFVRVAAFAVALLAATAALGLWIGDLHGTLDPGLLRWATVHRLSGVLTALVVVLVNSITVTYFIGTGRWCKEVVEAYGLDRAFAARSTALKRSAFPFALLGMLATGRAGSRDWVTAHLVGGIGLAAAIAWCFRAQFGAIVRQHRLIDEVMAEVRRERAARGLDVEPVSQ